MCLKVSNFRVLFKVCFEIDKLLYPVSTEKKTIAGFDFNLLIINVDEVIHTHGTTEILSLFINHIAVVARELFQLACANAVNAGVADMKNVRMVRL